VKNSRHLEPFYLGGAFYLWTKIREFSEGTRDSWDFSKYLLEKTSVGYTPGAIFGSNSDHYIRFAFITKKEDIREASELIEKFV